MLYFYTMIEIDFSTYEANQLNSIDLEVKECVQMKTQNQNEIFLTSGTLGDKKAFEFTQEQIQQSVKQTLE
jgi:hypothetical protein